MATSKEPESCSSITTTHVDGLENKRRCDGWVFVWDYFFGYYYVCHYLPLLLSKFIAKPKSGASGLLFTKIGFIFSSVLKI